MIQLSHTAFLRLPQIIGQDEVTQEQATENIKQNKGPKKPRPQIKPLIPVCKSSWWSGIASKIYPAGRKLGPRTTAWLKSDIEELCTRLEKGGK